MHDLGHHRQRPHRARADARHQQQLGEIGRAAIGRRGEVAVQPPRDHVLGAHVVMRRHDEMRQRQLVAGSRRGRAPRAFDPRQLARDPVRPERLQQVELGAPREPRRGGR